MDVGECVAVGVEPLFHRFVGLSWVDGSSALGAFDAVGEPLVCDYWVFQGSGRSSLVSLVGRVVRLVLLPSEATVVAAPDFVWPECLVYA